MSSSGRWSCFCSSSGMGPFYSEVRPYKPFINWSMHANLICCRCRCVYSVVSVILCSSIVTKTASVMLLCPWEVHSRCMAYIALSPRAHVITITYISRPPSIIQPG